MTPETLRSWAWLLVGGLTLAFSLWLLVPWRPAAFSADLDDYLDTSWMVMLHDAFVTKAAFGSEFVMTFGLGGFASTRAYYPGTFGWLIGS